MALQTQQLSSTEQSENLWQKALDTLDEDTKNYLDYQNAVKRDVLAALLRTAQEKRSLCLRKRWKFKKSNGQEVVLRDVVEKIIIWLDKFKAVGDIAMQYDPAHASLAWAGVRFLLRVSLSSNTGFLGGSDLMSSIGRCQ
jgi:hypothetical protein